MQDLDCLQQKGLLQDCECPLEKTELAYLKDNVFMHLS